jgi:ABC-type nitrate/sulfonate/bicarbonate transport system ATPase subunit
MVEIDIAHKAFADRGGRRHVALAGVRLALADGEFVCLVGPSGCGKTTLLNIVGGLEREFDGEVRHPAGQRIGTVFQTPRLLPWLTVLDNVCLVSTAPDAGARARALLGAMELGDVLHAFPGQLSGGMQRRVALARAFIIEPTLLLLDEPFVSLDTPTAERLRAMLVALWTRHRGTVLYVTHDVHEALALADRVCFMSGAPGRVVLDVPVALPRPRKADDRAVRELYAALLQRHPELLAGLAAAATVTVEAAADA